MAAVLIGCLCPSPTYASDPGVRFVDTVPRAFGGGRPVYGNLVVKRTREQQRGDVVGAGLYNVTDPVVVDALLDADRRGVQVRVVTWRQNGGDQDSDGADPTGQTKRLVDALEHPQTKGSWVKVCRGSCRRSGTTGIWHVKLFTFSRGHRVLQGSGNSTVETDLRGWNSFDEVSGSGVLYRAFLGYLESSRADKTLGDYPDAHDGALTARFFPREHGDDLVVEQLRASQGYQAPPGQVPCHVVLSQFKVTVHELDAYDELMRIRREGCWVQVTVNWNGADNADRWEAKVRQMAAAGVEVWDASHVEPHVVGGAVYPATDDSYYDHDKQVGIRATQGGTVAEVRVNGSPTMSTSARTANGETQLMVRTPAAAQHTFDRFALLTGRGARRLRF